MSVKTFVKKMTEKNVSEFFNLNTLFVFVSSYLLGSIPFGLLFAKMAGLGDIRNIGSGNIGATNVLRTGNKKIAAATLICDALKGTLAVFIASHFGNALMMLAACIVILGHIFPLWLKFKGGKGVATALGALFFLSPTLGVLTCLTWIILAKVFKTSSLSALIAFLVLPFFAWFLFGTNELFFTTLAVMFLIFFTHRSNITRILSGIEPKIGEHKSI